MSGSSMPPAAPPPPTPGGERESVAREVLAFKLGEEEYGIDIQSVQELRGYEAVTRIANAPPYLMGVVNLRGIIVPIMDLRVKFGIGAPRYDQFTVVVIVNVASRTVGMVVDGVSDVITLTAEQLRPPPELGAMVATGYLVGMGVLDDRMLILVDVARLVSDGDVAEIEKMAA